MFKSVIVAGVIALVLLVLIFSGTIETSTQRLGSTDEIIGYQFGVNFGMRSIYFDIPSTLITFLTAIGVNHVNSQVYYEQPNPFGTPE